MRNHWANRRRLRVVSPAQLREVQSVRTKLPDRCFIPARLPDSAASAMGKRVAATNEPYAGRQRQISKKKSRYAFTLDKPLKTLFCTWKQTVLPSTCKRVEVWFWTMVHVGLFILIHMHEWLGKPGEGDDKKDTMVVEYIEYFLKTYIPISLSSVGISSGFMALLLVFFNSQCYSRFMAYYSACTGMGGAIQELCFLLTSQLGELQADVWDASRFAVGSVMVTYLKVTDLDDGKEMAIDADDWNRLTSSEESWLGKDVGTGSPKMPPILAQEEVDILKKCPGKETQVLMMWCMGVLHRAYNDVGLAGSPQAAAAEDCVLRLRRSVAFIPNMINQPVPLPYYHALVMLMQINYLLYSVAFLSIDSYFTPLAVFLIIVVSTGVRELSSALANPFGEDEVDFNVPNYMHSLRALVSFMAHGSDWQHTGGARLPAPANRQLQLAPEKQAAAPQMMAQPAQPAPNGHHPELGHTSLQIGHREPPPLSPRYAPHYPPALPTGFNIAMPALPPISGTTGLRPTTAQLPYYTLEPSTGQWRTVGGTVGSQGGFVASPSEVTCGRARTPKARLP